MPADRHQPPSQRRQRTPGRRGLAVVDGGAGRVSSTRLSQLDPDELVRIRAGGDLLELTRHERALLDLLDAAEVARGEL